MQKSTEIDVQCCSTEIEKCDTFDFMANVIGLPILHPGGHNASDEMMRLLEIKPEAQVLDLACGRGTNAIYIAKKSHANVIGVDCDERLIQEAAANAEAHGMSGKTRFQVAHAENLPFANNQFDFVVLQAVLIMVQDERKVIAEALRVLRPNGRIGILELTWKMQPPDHFFYEAEAICPYFKKVKTAAGWKELIYQGKVVETETRLHEMACPCTMRELGLKKSLAIFFKQAFNSRIRRRMHEIDSFVGGNDRYFGYGIYVGSKTE
jgi:ubiquinone/menaquinone biosynthesis C-methylase UbiE